MVWPTLGSRTAKEQNTEAFRRVAASELTLSLAQWVYNTNSHWPMCDVDEHRPVGTSETVGLLDSHVVPVAPVHPVLEDRQ